MIKTISALFLTTLFATTVFANDLINMFEEQPGGYNGGGQTNPPPPPPPADYPPPPPADYPPAQAGESIQDTLRRIEKKIDYVQRRLETVISARGGQNRNDVTASVNVDVLQASINGITQNGNFAADVDRLVTVINSIKGTPNLQICTRVYTETNLRCVTMATNAVTGNGNFSIDGTNASKLIDACNTIHYKCN